MAAPPFSVIVQAPEIRALVQENLLERAFHDALFPRLLFRGEATPAEWAANVGDSMFMTAPGLMPVRKAPLQPGQDPLPQEYPSEQWPATLRQYANSIDTNMPTSINAIANLFRRNAQQLGLNAAETLDGIVRNAMYNAAMAGHTVADGASGGAVNTFRVARLNGFTDARGNSGSEVRYQPVSGGNPLPVTVLDSGTPVSRNVIAFAPDTAGDCFGPGTITIDGAAITVADRDPVLSVERTFLHRVGGGDSVDAIGPTDLFRLQDVRAAVSRFQDSNVPDMPDGRYHCHLDPTSVSQVFSDAEFNRLLTALPDHYMYKQFALGELLGCIFFRNSQAPKPNTVLGTGAFAGGTTEGYTIQDPFGGELFNGGVASGVSPLGTVVHRPLFIGQDAIFEYHQSLEQLVTEAGLNGKVGEFSISNNGIQVMADRIQLILRAPQDRLQQKVSASWNFIGDWPVRTDVTTGDAAKYKRLLVVEHGA